MDQPTQNLRPPATVNDHLKELTMRLLVSVVAMAVAGTVVFLFYAQILSFLSSPLGAPLYYNTPAGSFSFVMRICLMGSLIITIPVLAFNIIMFIRPAFEKELSMKRVILTALSSTILAITGAVFAFYCILPGTLKFFSDFQVTGLNALISADSYLSFVVNLITMFVLVFQIPLIILFIDHIKPLKPINLIRKGKWVIIGSLVITILQPFTYDLVTSLYIAAPMIGLYYLSIIVVLAQHSREKRKERKIVHAVIARPVLLPSEAAGELVLSEQTLANLTDELADLEKPVILPAIPTTTVRMDVGSSHTQTEKVEPPAWFVERSARRAALSAQVRVFSDFKPRPNTQRAIA